jgi:hypothetical protein
MSADKELPLSRQAFVYNLIYCQDGLAIAFKERFVPPNDNSHNFGIKSSEYSHEGYVIVTSINMPILFVKAESTETRTALIRILDNKVALPINDHWQTRVQPPSIKSYYNSRCYASIFDLCRSSDYYKYKNEDCRKFIRYPDGISSTNFVVPYVAFWTGLACIASVPHLKCPFVNACSQDKTEGDMDKIFRISTDGIDENMDKLMDGKLIPEIPRGGKEGFIVEGSCSKTRPLAKKAKKLTLKTTEVTK